MDQDHPSTYRPSGHRSTVVRRNDNQENHTMAAPGSIVRATVPTVKNILATFEKFEDLEQLPPAFHAVTDAVEDVERVISKVPDRLDATGQAAWPDISAIVKEWQAKIKLVDGIFLDIASHSKDKGSWAMVLGDYRTFLRDAANGQRVEELMKVALERFSSLSTHDAFGKSPERYLTKFKVAIEKLSKAKPSNADLDGTAHHYTQNVSAGGNAWQNINHGDNQQVSYGGTQYNISGSGTHHYVNNVADATVEDRKRKSRNKILQALHTSPYKLAKDRNPVHVPGTCQWFVQHPCFQDWLTSDMPSILWVSADPGAGKSVLAKHLIDNVLPKASEDTVICYFFFKDDFDEQKSARTAISCILHQLLTVDDGFFSDQVQTRLEVGQGYEKLSLHDLWDVLTMAVAQYCPTSNFSRDVVCVIDALDECSNNDQSEFANVMCDYFGRSLNGSKTNLKLLITSRPYDRIRKTLQPLHDIPALKMIRLSGEDEALVSQIEDEIRVFVGSKVRDVARLQMLTPEEEANLLAGILQFPNRTYLWAHLILDLIRLDFDEEMELHKVTSHLPPNVDAAYERILSKSKDPAKTRKLLHIIIGAVHPLTLEEMNVALAVEPHHEAFDEIRLVPETRFLEYVRNLCGLFVTIENSRIYLLHQTAREFLVNKTSATTTSPEADQGRLRWKSSIRLTESNRILSQICIRLLHLTPNPDRIPKPARHVVLLAKYSAANWIQHYKESGDQMDHEAALSIMSLGGVNTLQNPWWSRFCILYNFPSGNLFLDTNKEAGFCATSLIMSSHLGLWQVATMLLADNLVDANIKDTLYRRTALAWACGYGFLEMVKVLLKHCKRDVHTKTQDPGSTNVQLDPMDRFGDTPLHLALKRGNDDISELLIRAGARLDIRNTSNETPLILAVKCCNESTVRILLDAGAKVEVQNPVGGILLAYAVARDSFITQELIESGARIGKRGRLVMSDFLRAIKDSDDKAVMRFINAGMDMSLLGFLSTECLLDAVMRGHTNIARALVYAGAPLDSHGYTGDTPLISAVKQGHHEIILLLLEAGASVDMADMFNRTPLSWSASKDLELATAHLLRYGADIETADSSHRTPLHWAAMEGSSSSINQLLRHGAFVNPVDAKGHTPLSSAIALGQEDEINCLLAGGADPNTAAFSGNEAISLAIEYRSIKAIRSLISAGVDVHSPDKNGRTLLSILVCEYIPGAVQVLLDAGASVDMADERGRTPLAWAAGQPSDWRNPSELIESHIQCLIDSGANVNIPDAFGRTALMWAVDRGHPEVILSLIRAGADVNVADINGDTSLSLALKRGIPRILHALRKAGADETIRRDYQNQQRAAIDWEFPK